MLAIRTERLSKKYADTVALRDLDLEVAAGRGARLPRPERRRQDHDDPVPARHGPGDRGTCRDLRHRCAAPPCGGPPSSGVRAGGGVPVAEADGRRDARSAGHDPGTGGHCPYRSQLVERFKLDPSKRVRAYSKGNRQKVLLIAAFSSRADLLVLDEPTSGLDPLMEAAFRECVLEARARGQAVFLSSHILSEVEALSDRVAILRAGELVEVGTLAQLRHLSTLSIEATFDGAPPDLSRVPGVSAFRTEGNALHCQVAGSVEPLLGVLAASGVHQLLSREPSLEELFLAHYGREENDPARAARSMSEPRTDWRTRYAVAHSTARRAGVSGAIWGRRLRPAARQRGARLPLELPDCRLPGGVRTVVRGERRAHRHHRPGPAPGHDRGFRVVADVLPDDRDRRYVGPPDSDAPAARRRGRRPLGTHARRPSDAAFGDPPGPSAAWRSGCSPW